MRRWNRDILKAFERETQSLELSYLFDSRKDFLADWADDGYAAVLDRFGENRNDALLVFAQKSFVPAPQRKGPDTTIDQNLHGSISIRSSSRTFL